MLELKFARELSWSDLKHIEAPRNALRLIQINHGRNFSLDDIRNAHRHDLPRAGYRKLFDPYSRIQQQLDNGQTFLINRMTRTPVFTTLELLDNDQVAWELRGAISQRFRTSMESIIARVPKPKPNGVHRQEPAKQNDDQPKKEQPVRESHQIIIDVKTQNDMPIPDRHNITIFIENNTKSRTAVKQRRDAVRDGQSRVYSIEKGEQFTVYVIDETKKAVLKDLNANRNLQDSIANELIAESTIVKTEVNEKGVNVHTVEYEIQDTRDEIVEAIYRLDTNEILFFTQDELEGLDEEEKLIYDSMQCLRNALEQDNQSTQDLDVIASESEGEITSDIQKAKEEAKNNLIELGVVDEKVSSLPKLTEVERLAGHHRTWIRSSAMKNHWRKYKMDAKDKAASKGWYDLANKKIDYEKLAKSVSSDLNFKFKTGEINWAASNDEVLERMGLKWQGKLSESNPSIKEDYGFDVSAEAQVLRFAAMAGASSEVDLTEGKVAIQAQASAEFDLAKGKVTASQVFPVNSRSQIQVKYSIKTEEGRIEFRDFSMGHFQAELEASLIGQAGVSALLAANVMVGCHDGTPRIRGANTGVNGSAGAFAGARGGCEIKGKLKWADELTQEKKWVDLCEIGKKVEGAIGAGAEAGVTFDFNKKSGKFLLKAHAGLVIGVGAAGSFVLEVSTRAIITMVRFMYQGLRAVDYRQLKLFGSEAFDAYTNLCIYSLAYGVDSIDSLYESGSEFANEINDYIAGIKEKNRIEQAALELAKGIMNSSAQKEDILLLSPPEVKGRLMYLLIYDGFGFIDDFLDDKALKRSAVIKILNSIQSGRDYMETMSRVNKNGDSQNNKMDQNARFVFDFLGLGEDQQSKFEMRIINRTPNVGAPLDYEAYHLCQECGVA